MLERQDKKARAILFSGNKSELSRKSGIPPRTLYNKFEKPGTLTLDQLAALVWAQDLDKDDLWELVRRRV